MLAHSMDTTNSTMLINGRIWGEELLREVLRRHREVSIGDGSWYFIDLRLNVCQIPRITSTKTSFDGLESRRVHLATHLTLSGIEHLSTYLGRWPEPRMATRQDLIAIEMGIVTPQRRWLGERDVFRCSKLLVDTYRAFCAVLEALRDKGLRTAEKEFSLNNPRRDAVLWAGIDRDPQN